MSRLLFLSLLAVAIVSGSPGVRAQSNDNFASRLTLTGFAPIAVSNNLPATREASEPNHAGAGAGRSLWYTWTAPTTGTVNLGTYYTGSGAPTVRAIAVYAGSTLASLSEVASSNNQAQSLFAAGTYSSTLFVGGTSINVPVIAGTVYQIAVDAISTPTAVDDDGTVVLAINAPPTILSAASAAGTTGAVFSFTVVATGGATGFGATGLPAGLVLNPATGLITGTPTAAGTSNVLLSATGPGGSGTAVLNLAISDPAAAAVALPVITSAASARAFVGAAFSYTVAASGSPTAYTASGLSAGLSFNATTHAIVGTPTTAGVFAMPISATNAAGTGSAVVTVAVSAAPPLPIITSALAVSGTVGTTFSYSLTTNLDGIAGASPTGGTATNLPPGLTRGSGGSFVGGTPTQAGTYLVPLTVTNAAGTRTAAVTITILPAGTSTNTVAPAAPVLSSFASVQGVVGAAFSYTLTASNAPTSFTADSLPAGLSLNATTGVISGLPTAAGTFTVPVTAANGYGASSGLLTIAIFANNVARAAANGFALPVFTSAGGAGGYVGQAFTYGATATVQGTSAFGGNWTFSATGLPPGLTLTSSTSYVGSVSISGTPTTSGTYVATLSATCPAAVASYYSQPAATGTAKVTFVILPAPALALPVITSALAASGTAGAALSYTVAASNSPGSFAAGNLPPGVSIDPASGNISGTPTSAGVYASTVSATNAAGTSAATVTFRIAAQALPVFGAYATFTPLVGSAFSFTFTATNSPTGYAASSLPPGLSFNSATGTLSGTPTTVGKYAVPISASNASGTTTVTATFDVHKAFPPVITSYAVTSGTVGGHVFESLSFENNPTSVRVSGLPPGATFDGTSITGAPTAAGVYPVSITASNAGGTSTATTTITVVNPGVPGFGTQGGVLSATPQQYFSTSISVNTPNTTFAFSGLPPGVTANSACPGFLEGTPTTSGTYRVGVTATDAAGSAHAVLTIVVGANPNAPNLGNATPLQKTLTVGTSDSLTIYTSNTATGYSATGLPPGLSLDASAGVIRGTPTTTGTFAATITTSNSAGSASAVVTYVVAQPVVAPPVFDSLAASLAGNVGAVFTGRDVVATNNPTSYAASGLPPGLSIDTSTGAVTGKPTVAGRYPVTLSATNAGGTGTALWTLFIREATDVLIVFTYTTDLQVAGTVGGYQSLEFYAYLTDGSSAYVDEGTTLSVTGTPPGMNANRVGIDGTPTTAGAYPLTITLTAAGGASATESILYIVAPANAPSLTSASQAAGPQYAAFGYSLSAFGASMYGCGALPAGLSFNPYSGAITGTPTVTGTFSVPVTVVGTYATSAATLTIRIDPPLYGGLPVIGSAAGIGSQDFPLDSSPLANFTSPAVNFTLSALNGAATFTVGNVPTGMVFNPTTGTLSGTPTTTGVYLLPITATNAAGTVDGTLTLVAGSPRATARPALAYGGSVGGSFVTTATPLYFPALLSAYATGTGYSTALDPIVYSAAGLPSGLSINSYTGQITGTPTQAGTYPVTLTAANRGGSGSAVATLAIGAVAPPAAAPPVWSGKAEVAGFLGVPMSYTLTASAATNYAATGLPAGLSLDASTGVISGTPTATGMSQVTVSAGNSAGTTQAALTIAIEAAPFAPVVSSASATTATVGSTFSYNLTTANFSGLPAGTGYSTLASALPAGLGLNPVTGVISGTPNGPAGSYAVPITVATGPTTTTSATVTLVVQPAPSSPVVSSAAGARGFVGNPFSYAIRNAAFLPDVGSLPAGLTYDAISGSISGYPQASGTYSIPLFAPGSSGGNSAVTPTLTVQVLAPQYSLPRLTIQPTGGSAMEGDSFVFSSAAVGIPNPTFQWSHNGTPLAGANGPALTLGPLQTTDSGIYVLTVGNAAGSVTSAIATLLVQTSYAKWQADHFTPSEIAAGLADASNSFSGDGVPNLLKYALDLDPRANAAGSALPTVVPPGVDGLLGIGFLRDASRSDIDYLVESSPDLSVWTKIAESDFGATVSNLGAITVLEMGIPGTSRYQVTIKAAPPAGGTQFLRVRIIRP